MPRRIGRFKSEEIEDHILRFLKLNGSSYFGEIRDYLEKKPKIKFKNAKDDRSGLSHTLKRMQTKKMIRKLPKDKEHIYPRYTPIDQSTFEASLDGYLIRDEIDNALSTDAQTKLFDEIKKIQRKRNLNDDEEIILKLIYRFGFMVLYFMMLASTRKFNSIKEKNKESYDAWLRNALDFHNIRNPIVNGFHAEVQKQLTYNEEIDKETEEEIQDEVDKIIESRLEIDTQNKISQLKDVMKKMLPETADLMEFEESNIDQVRNDIKNSWLEKPPQILPLREF